MPADSSASDARHQRTVDFLGAEGFARLRAATVAVIGLGGVGSHAACLLARSGVGTLRLVDFDRVTASSLNRSAVATPADVGRSKAQVVAAYVARVAPGTRVEALEVFVHDDTAASVLAAPLAHVIDAIDSETPKAALLAHCLRAGLPVVSCMGAAARNDPSMIRVADLFATAMCALARNVRGRLRKMGVTGHVPAIYSIETPRRALPPDEDEVTLRRGRPRMRLPSLGTVPGIVGYAAAGMVIEQLARGPSGR